MDEKDGCAFPFLLVFVKGLVGEIFLSQVRREMEE